MGQISEVNWEEIIKNKKVEECSTEETKNVTDTVDTVEEV